MKVFVTSSIFLMATVLRSKSAMENETFHVGSCSSTTVM